MAIPASLMGFGILFAYSSPPFSLYGTSAIIVVTYVTLMIGYSTRLQSATLLGMGTEFREASMTSGAGPLRTLLQIMFPMARKGMAAAAALTFVMLSHEFSASMMVRSVRTQVMGSMMYDIWSGGIYPEAAVMALVMVAVTVVGVIFATWIAGSDAMKQMS
jgi:iron(III) transport system permease protein